MSEAGPDVKNAKSTVDPGHRAVRHVTPRGIVDLRGRTDAGICLSYPQNAVVVIAGLPGSGKSTLLRAWAPSGTVLDPRTTRSACEAVMPSWLPYAVYRPVARLHHMRRVRTAMRGSAPLLIHDCGTRTWLRRWLARSADRTGRPAHMVLLDVGVQEALSGQRARRRLTSPRVFAAHERGLAALLSGIGGSGPRRPAEFTSVVLLDRRLRDTSPHARFTGPPAPSREPEGAADVCPVELVEDGRREP
ncbi:AAA family ATPase [Streptomyces sp. NPDC029216]|uniref:AAA family ATPase n=1 Tax=Streptomyces sp. NPDC029216 TaxID=3154701 RepID=UPI0033E5F59F